MTGENAPPQDGWKGPCRCDLAACKDCHPPLRIGPNIVLGTE